jgi:sensor c-di-GMP phosphodiesterase-like protein
MKKQDEELQNSIERGLVHDETEDARAYRRVFEALKKEPDFQVPISFADRMIALIDKREEKRDHWWLGAGIFLSLMAMIVAVTLTDADFSINAFKFFSGYRGLVFFGIAFILLLHWIDKKMIRKQIT